MKIAVTGGAGFIGRTLVPALAQAGHDVVTLDNLKRGRRMLHPCSRVEERIGDIRDLDACNTAFSGCDAVVHLAAQANVIGTENDPDYAFETNVQGTWNVARAAAMVGVRHLVFASSREVYGNAKRLPVNECAPFAPHNLYGASKVAGEVLLNSQAVGGAPVSILRLSNVIGPGDHDRVVPNWLHAARCGEPLVLYGGTQELDLVPVTFVAEVILQLVLQGPTAGPINVGSGTATRLPDLAAHILDVTGSTSPVEFRAPRGPEVTRFRADVSRLRKWLGLESPASPLEYISADW